MAEENILTGASTLLALGDSISKIGQTAGQIQAVWAGAGGSGATVAIPITQPAGPAASSAAVKAGPVPIASTLQPTWVEMMAFKLGLPVWAIWVLVAAVPLLLAGLAVTFFKRKR